MLAWSMESAVNIHTADQQIYRIRDLRNKFKQSCTQLRQIINYLHQVEVRYKRACKQNHRSYRYVLQLHLVSLRSIKHMFHAYAYAKADQLEKMQADLFNHTGIAWNNELAQDTDEEDGESVGDANTE